MAKKLTMEQYIAGLKKFDKNSPKMAKAILDNLATTTQSNLKKSYKKEFTLKNNYTDNSTKVRKSKANKDLKQMKSITYTTAEYMGLHETGGTQKKNLWAANGKMNNVPLPTLASRGGNSQAPILNRLRINTQYGGLGTIGRHVKGRGYKNGMSFSTRGAYFVTHRASGIRLIKMRLGRKGESVTIRPIVPSQKIKKRALFKKATAATLKSRNVGRMVKTEIKSKLP